MAAPRKFDRAHRINVSIEAKAAALIPIVAADFENNFSAFITAAIRAYCDLKLDNDASVSPDEYTARMHQVRLQEIASEKELLELQERAHRGAQRKITEKATRKQTAKRARYPIPEILARDLAYAPEPDIRRRAVEHGHEPDAVMHIVLGIRKDAEARASMHERPEPVTFEDWVAHDAEFLKRRRGPDFDAAVAVVRKTAHAQGYDPTRYVSAVRAAAGLDGQQNLLVTVQEREDA